MGGIKIKMVRRYKVDLREEWLRNGFDQKAIIGGKE